MNKSLLGLKVAILVANGFSQDEMITVHKALTEEGANVRVISPESGLVNGWDGSMWGHHFAVDTSLASALAADYSVLVIPGGQRSIDKLNLTAHTKRFVTSFMNADKPVVVMNEGLHLLILTDNIKGRSVSGPHTMSDLLTQSGAHYSKKPLSCDDNLFTGVFDYGVSEKFISEMRAFLGDAANDQKVA